MRLICWNTISFTWLRKGRERRFACVKFKRYFSNLSSYILTYSFSLLKYCICWNTAWTRERREEQRAISVTSLDRHLRIIILVCWNTACTREGLEKRFGFGKLKHHFSNLSRYVLAYYSFSLLKYYICWNITSVEILHEGERNRRNNMRCFPG